MNSSPFFQELTTTARRAALAMRVLVHPNITLAEAHVSRVKDTATPRHNTLQSMFLMRAQRSCYQNAPCGEVPISTTLLTAMLDLARTYRFHVSEIAGGSHSARSRHYAGVALDVTSINGEPVSADNRFVGAFMMRCKALGATEVLGPGHPGHSGHIHAAWPRPRDL